MVATRENRPIATVSVADTVEPGDAVTVADVGFDHGRYQVIEPGEPLGVHPHPRRLDRNQPQDGADNDTGEAHTTGCGPEQLWVSIRGDGDHATRRDEGHLHDVPDEAAVAMMVLSVDVCGDGTADGDIAGSGRHRYEPARGDETPHQIMQAHAPADLDRSRRLVQFADAAKACRVEDEPARALRGVPVTPPQAPGDDTTGLGAERGQNGGRVRRTANQGGGGCGPPPARQRPEGALEADAHR